jgi:2-(1,2-epoxy-1,2-dihydrophenyl)acetyl-CoA isomerase
VNPRLAAELPAAVADAAADDAVRVVVITGAGRGFCAGLDLGEPLDVWQGTRAERLDPLAWVGRWVLSIVGCEKPVIAAVNGVAAGAGFGLALAADVRLVSSAATLTAGYVRRGLSPDAGVSYFLPRQIGLARAADIILTGATWTPRKPSGSGWRAACSRPSGSRRTWPRTPSAWRPARRSRWR